MGLDILALRNATQTVKSNYPTAHPDSNFEERADGILDGSHWIAEEEFGFRAGSYSGYNAWRDDLAVMAGAESAEEYWNGYRGPFWQLIHFSDCEGVIGPATSALLARDFVDWQPQAEVIGGSFLATYNHFRKAFEMAAQKGMVLFK